MTIALRHFGIVVQDLDRALDFYGGLLALKVIRRMDEHGPFVDTILGHQAVRVTTVKLGGTNGETLLELLKFHTPEVVEQSNARGLFHIGPTHLALTVGDIDALCERLRAAGVRFISAPQVSADGLAKVCFCSDPEGTPVELVQLL